MELENVERNLKKDKIRKIFFVVYKNKKAADNFLESNGYNKRKDLNYRDKGMKKIKTKKHNCTSYNQR